MRVVYFPKNIEQTEISVLLKELDKEFPIISKSINRTREGHKLTLTRLSGANNLDECVQTIESWIQEQY